MRIKLIFVILFCFITSLLFSGETRSSEWNNVRKAHLKIEPECQICMSMKSRQVHHIHPYHYFHKLELHQENLITVCTSKYWGFNCHFDVAHAGNFKYYNPWIKEDIAFIKYIVSCNEDKITPTTSTQIEDYLKFIHLRTKEFNTQLKYILQDPSSLDEEEDLSKEALDKLKQVKMEIDDKYVFKLKTL